MKALLSVEPSLWKKEAADLRGYFEQFGTRVPGELLEELKGLESRLG
jgi:GTP-dependent phosphoenolpyruvate carboxykinase